MTNPDALIQRCSEMLSYVKRLNVALSDSANKSINGPFLCRPVYAEEFRKLAAQAREDEKLILEGARALTIVIEQSKKSPNVSFSQAQVQGMFDFLEMLKRPLFHALGDDAKYLHPGLNVKVQRDC